MSRGSRGGRTSLPAESAAGYGSEGAPRPGSEGGSGPGERENGGEGTHRSGVVALLGRPNAGKSTLLNRWVGEHLAIVTPRPQTTRCRILGILSRPGAQVLLLDTPGLVPGRKGLLDERMRKAVADAIADCDVALLLVDPSRGWGAAEEELRGLLAEGDARALLVGTKADLRGEGPTAGDRPWPLPRWEGPVLQISARTGEGCEELLDAAVAELPEGSPFYPEDQLTDRPLRFLAAEYVREAAFELLAEEVPYGVAVEVEDFDESRPDLVAIRANLLLAREAHKPIAVGAGGRTVREIGSRARRGLEELLGRRVHLELWVKVDRTWSRRPNRLKSLGYF